MELNIFQGISLASILLSVAAIYWRLRERLMRVDARIERVEQKLDVSLEAIDSRLDRIERIQNGGRG